LGSIHHVFHHKNLKKDGEAPQPFLELPPALAWRLEAGTGQMNEEILKEYKMKSKNKLGIHSIRPVT
jgi:hypothetical protein